MIATFSRFDSLLRHQMTTDLARKARAVLMSARPAPLCTSTGKAVECTCRSGREPMTDAHIERPQGTLDLSILKTLTLGPQHGWGVSERLHQISSETLAIRQGWLYPALHRLERRAWIKARWRASENNRRAKYYELTRKGRAQLAAETAAWRRLSAAIGVVLEAR